MEGMIYKTEIEKLENHDKNQKFGFSVNYKIGQPFVYILGGMYLGGSSKLRRDLQSVFKFDVKTQKWHDFPKMCQRRYQPGTFITADGTFLYAFGGDSSFVERIDVTKDGAKWEQIDTTYCSRLPKLNKYGNENNQSVSFPR